MHFCSFEQFLKNTYNTYTLLCVKMSKLVCFIPSVISSPETVIQLLMDNYILVIVSAVIVTLVLLFVIRGKIQSN